jgi:hypothetical protein
VSPHLDFDGEHVPNGLASAQGCLGDVDTQARPAPVMSQTFFLVVLIWTTVDRKTQAPHNGQRQTVLAGVVG